MDIGVLGPLVVSNGMRPVVLGGLRQRRLLTALVANVGHVVSTDRLAEIVFENEPSDRASTTIRSYVARLRRALSTPELAGSEVILTEPPGYVLRLDDSHIDAHRFVTGAESGRRLLDDRDAVAAATVLHQALELWRGDAYEEFAAEEWAQADAAKLDEERINTEETLVEALLACGRDDEVVPRLRRLIAEQPLRERPRRQLMLALYRAGRQAESLRAFQAYRTSLIDVALEPSGELVALDRQIAVQDPALQLTSPAGRSLRGYRLGATLGSGVHGVVFRGIQPGVGRDVAVKTIRPELADDPSFIRRFDAEARTVSRLEHPYIVPIYDFWREPGGAYLVMRLLEGDLAARLADGPMSIDDVAVMANQLGSALVAAHRSTVIHGDIKPTNVLVDAQFNVYLADFGVATYGSRRDRLTPVSSGYEAPEQLAGEQASEASDQFALAVLTAHALTGVLPFGQRAVASPHERVGSVHLRRPSVPVAVDAVLERATVWSPHDRYPDVGSFIDDLLTALGHSSSRLAATTEIENPYVGLRPFDESDTETFFGRESVIDELLERLGSCGPASRFVALIGASGSGKSSIVRAGLLPRLRAGAVAGSEDWYLTTMTPGTDPDLALYAALRSIAVGPVPHPGELESDHVVDRLLESAVPPGATVLLVVDQLEELFTMVADESARRRFATALSDAVQRADLDVRVVTTLRADFFDRPLRYHDLGMLLNEGGIAIAALSAAELDEAVRGPSATVGVDVEAALASALVSDVVDQPAALPLLQFSLTELFEQRPGHTLTLASYRELGGVNAAVACRADALFDQLDDKDRSVVHRMFLRLVTVGTDGTATRRRALRSGLVTAASDPEQIDVVLDRFGAARLLTFDRDESTRSPTVEVAHEALISHWPRLTSWVREAGDGLRIQTHLTEATATWLERGRDDSELYRGTRLDDAIEWSGEADSAVSDDERGFLRAGIEQRHREETTEREQVERQQLAHRRRRTQLVLVAILLVVSVLAGLVAVQQRNSSRTQASVARARELAAASTSNLDRDPELAVLLALEAAESNGSSVLPEAEHALHAAVAANRTVARVSASPSGIASFYPDGESFLAIDDEEITATVWQRDPIARRFSLVGHDGRILDAEVGPDGRRIATTSVDGTVRLWDAGTGEEVLVIDGGGRVTAIPAFSSDGSMVAATMWWDGDDEASDAVGVWSVETGEQLELFEPPPGTVRPLNVEFSPDDTLLAVTFAVDGEEAADGARTFDLTTGRIRTYEGHTARVTDVAFTPDGSMLITTSEDTTANVYDVPTGAILRTYRGHDRPLRDIEVDATGTFVATSGFDVQLWDLATLAPLDVTVNHARADGLDISPDGERLLTSSSFDTSVLVSDITPYGGHELAGFPGAVGAVTSVPFIDALMVPGGVAFTPDGTLLAASDDRDGVTVWDLETRTATTDVNVGTEVVSVSFNSDGSKLAIGSSDAVGVWSVESGTQIASREYEGRVTDVGFLAHSDRLLVSGLFGVELVSPDESVRVLDTELSLVAASSADGAFVFVPDRFAIVSSTSGEDLAVATPGDSFFGSEGITAAAFNHDGTTIAVAEVTDGAQIALRRTDGALDSFEVLSRPEGSIWDLEFSPTGSDLASVDSVGNIHVWDLETEPVSSLLLSSPGATDIAFSPDGRHLAASGTNGAVTVFLLDVDDLVAEARRRLTRTWTQAECEQFQISSCKNDASRPT